ncbi:MAG TPA: PQQ-binding-like beta-propeller repeat protein, partial [Planctomycetota bacterium]|nr:PQQ-binding-like beta-propeller repeat protein [Planctomycetota bacterium]
LKDVTFQAAPTVFGERLLLPALRRGAYSLQCLDRSTGRPLWCTKLHAGGTHFVKAPGTPVQLMGGIAYVLTNAGCLAAVDAFAGDLKWVRRYERRDPHHKTSKNPRQRAQNLNFGNQFVEQELPSFLPSELLCADGLLVAAPCDGEALLCLDGASGDVRWFIDGSGAYAQYNKLQYLVGANARFLYLASQTDLLCVGRQSGVRLWSKKLPTDDALGNWRGRGCVLDDYVLMPGSREVLVLDAEGRQDWRRLKLPPFGVGPEPLATAANLTVAGPWLGVAYEAGIEVYSTASALRQLAAASREPLQQAGYLVVSGDADAAIDRLCSWLQESKAHPPELHTRAAAKLLNLARERALALASADQRDAATALLDRVRAFATDRTVRMNWHLARLDLWKQVQDLRAYADEQQRLYRFMEGKD